MKVQYFSDTDTLYVEFRASGIAELQDLDENTLLEVDEAGSVCALTFEYASMRTDVKQLTIEGFAAPLCDNARPATNVNCPRDRALDPDPGIRESGGSYDPEN